MVVAVAGLTADANILLNEARTKSLSHWKTFSKAIPIELLVQKIGNLKQGFTQMGGLRPFGVSLLYAGYDTTFGFQLYISDPSGNYSAWKATAVGAQSQAAQSYLKNEYSEGLTVIAAKELAFKTLKHVLVGENDQDVQTEMEKNSESSESDIFNVLATGIPVLLLLMK